MRVFVAQDPFLSFNLARHWRERGWWPAFWVDCLEAGQPPLVAAFRRRFHVVETATIRVHVTADERYNLFLDGERIGRGPERGAPDYWFYESYELALTPGDHTLVAQTWCLGEHAADAQMSVHPGFLLAAEGEWGQLLDTGVAPWEAKPLESYEFVNLPAAHWRGATVKVDGARFPWGFEHGHGDGWRPARKLGPGIGKRIDWELRPQHVLVPATLPPMLDRPFAAGAVRFVGDAPSASTSEIPIRIASSLKEEETSWTAFFHHETSITIHPHTLRRVLVDLEEYYCAYPEFVVTGGKGSLVRLHWAEALYLSPDPWRASKGHRDEVDGKYFLGMGDTFLPDGGVNRKFETLWWEAGRYVELFVETAAESLTLHRLTMYETRYPLEMESRFDASDTRLSQVAPVLARGLQMCANETYFDCPYYEELMYAADTRLEVLTHYVMARDDRLPRKALKMFDVSRLASGLTQSRYPCRTMQIITSWTLWWVAMVRDYAYWRCDTNYVRRMMPGVRATMEGFRRWYGPDGLLHAPEGWNNFDWVPEWDEEAGCPPDAVNGVSGVLNWHLIYTLTMYADLEERLDESLLAERAYWHASELAKRAVTAFWDEKRGLLADDLTHRHFSEHTQCLALLSSLLDDEKHRRVAEGLLTAPDLQRMTVYASFYLFETFRKLGRIDAMLERFGLWYDLVANGFKTPLEKPEPSRSDCHGWSSHPLYHYFATILGIRPSDIGFRSVEIKPQLGPLEHANGRLTHPRGGNIVVEVRQDPDGKLHGRVELPSEVCGTLNINDRVEFIPDGTVMEF